jgi:hypothetical protein
MYYNKEVVKKGELRMEYTLNQNKINFKKAVELARGFEGDWVARMALALKSVWKRATKYLEKIAKDIEESFALDGVFVTAKVWQKYGKRRIYVNSGRLSIGNFDFDGNGNYTKSWIEYSAWDCGKASEEMKYQKEWFENGYSI